MKEVLLKKIYIAAALASGLGFTFSAQAQSSVTLYGVADISVGITSRGDYQNVTSGTPAVTTRQSIGNAFRVDSGVQSASRFGIRGAEDLGDGLKAIFNAEAAWNVDDGTGAASGGLNFQRKSIVGLSAPAWGTVAFGRDYTPAWYAGAATDVGAYGFYGTDYAFANHGGLTTRSSNAIEWQSPTWGGLILRAMAGLSERDVSPKDQGNLYGLSGVYTAGAITASAYYQSLRVASATSTTSTTNQQQWGLGGGYNFGVARVVAGYGRNDQSGSNNKFDMYNVGVGVRLGAGELMGQYTRLKAGSGRNGTLSNATAGTRGQDGEAKIYMIAYTYPLSKRTNVYANYAQANNNAAGGFALYNNASGLIPGAAGQKEKALVFGLRHQF